MEEFLFIINPIAGSGKANDLEEVIISKMKSRKRAYKIKATKHPKDATQIVYESSIKTVVVVGGDGTITEVAKGIIKRGYGVLGIIPGGTGNDLIKSLGIENNICKSIDIILKGRTSEIDVGKVNGFIFLNVAGIGLDVEVLRREKNIRKYIKGKMSYILSVFITLIKFRKIQVEIEVEDKRYKKDLVLFNTGNGKFIGGGLQINPSAIIDDGYLHNSIVKDVNNLRILTIFPEIFKGTHIRHKKYVEIFKSKKIKIYSKEELYLNLDGEVFPAGKEIEFSLMDEKIEVLIP